MRLPVKQRPLVAPCYDHLGGRLGEQLARRLLELGWVSPEPNPGITPAGWAGLSQLGIDLGPLTASRRKPVNFCLERSGGQTYPHLGAHLGFLIRRHLLKAGWLEATPDGLAITPVGEQELRRLGLSLEEQA